MKIRTCTLLCASVFACSETESPVLMDAGFTDSGTTERNSLFAPALVPPELFDCRTNGIPERPSSAAPLNCAFDPNCIERLVVGHRSAGGTAPGLGLLAPENTMSAVRAAIAMGADFVETDPRSTKDGVIVNVHDVDLEGTTTSTAMVEESLWEDIQKLELKFPDTIKGDFSCDRVISIRELLLASKGRINVLLDANKLDDDDVETLVQVIRETDTFDIAVFDTSSIPKVIKARSLAPNIMVHIRPDSPEEIAMQIAEVGGVAPVILELPLNRLDESIALVEAQWPATNVMVDSLGALDFQSAVDGQASMSTMALYEAGVDMIQTDRIDLLLEAVGRLSGKP